MPCYLIHGTDEYRIAKRVDELLAGADLVSEMNLHHYDIELNPNAFPEAIECAFTPPFMGGKRVVVVAAIGALERKIKPATDDDDDDSGHSQSAVEIADKLAKLPEFSFVILFDRLRKLDGRGKLFKTLSSHCDVEEFKPLFFDPLSPDNRQLEQWLTARAKSHDIKLSPSGMRELALRLGSDLRSAEMEMTKFRLTFGNDASIGAKEVAQLTPPSTAHSIFSLCDALGQGRLETALEFLQGMLAAKAPAPYILTMLARHIRNIAIAKRLLELGKKEKEIQDVLSMKNRWVFDRFLPQAKRFRGSYKDAHSILALCDEQLKTSGLDPDTSLELCVINLAAMMQ
jgi:DNA polymerase-3 subunit delta